MESSDGESHMYFVMYTILTGVLPIYMMAFAHCPLNLNLHVHCAVILIQNIFLGLSLIHI